MRVLTIVGDLGMGGTQRAAQNYTLGYQQAGCEVSVLTVYGGGPRAEELGQAGVPVWIGGDSIDVREKALASAKAWKPDIIHIHRRGFADAESIDILRELKTSDNRVLETNVFSRVDYSADRSLIDVHLQLSKWCLWKWSRWSSHLRPRPIGAVVPYMVNSSAFYPAAEEKCIEFRREHGIPEDAFIFGRIGQRSLPKWSSIIIEAFAEVAQKNKQAYLLLVGLPDGLRSYVNALPSEVRQRVIEIPRIQGDENLRICYSAMDAFLHSSTIGESFGMVLVEAMLCECPVITLSTPDKDNSQLEVVGHEQGGLVVANHQSMINAMTRLLKDISFRAKLAQSGREQVKQNYELTEAMPALIEIAKTSLKVSSKSELQTMLKENEKCITEVHDAEIEALLFNVSGTTPLKNKWLMQLIHNPWFYQFYSRARLN